ncbi:Phosphate regulon sensor protein PhoR [Microbacterium sp. 8M]|jgi:two-component system sensor histidine kinase SenX3|uniref:sensor histidine kinase n=1 Tax=Microbacterium sp. 8M TaxID=2653153 RepID=UPI0012EFB96B|nr:ATP-binding protein [Microbacterium sp. 8M]VXB94631.1 Phosphate regulon sensor protein PhoR [Microbacterium sp. 8M]
MDSTLLALLALGLGVVIGAGIAAMIVAAMRARTAAELQASSELPDGLTDVLAAMDDAACAVDPSGLVTAASSAASRFGIGVGATLDNPELRQLVRAVREGGSETATLRLARGGRNLDPRLVAARASRIGPRLSLLIIRDITEQERLEQMRTDFVANTSHELKTPVGAVSLLAEAIESAADDPAQVRAFATRIQAEAARLGQLTGRIMSLSRLQSSDGLGEFGAVAIDEVIATSVEAHAVQAASAGVELTRGGERGAWVRGDAQILIEAVGNLIANAIVYSPRGSRVGVGVRVDDGVVEISVSDQGIGIDEADRERIFERFYRADEARSRRTGGTGLGLSIVKHATQRHGGEVRLWSRPGRGSTFTMRLPQIPSPEVEGDPGRRKKPKKDKPKKKRKAHKPPRTASSPVITTDQPRTDTGELV